MVVIVLSLVEYLIPERSSIEFVVIAGLSALIGGLLGNKLFPILKVHRTPSKRVRLQRRSTAFNHCLVKGCNCSTMYILCIRTSVLAENLIIGQLTHFRTMPDRLNKYVTKVNEIGEPIWETKIEKIKRCK